VQGATAAADPTIAARLEAHRCRLKARGVRASAIKPGFCPVAWV